MRVAAVASLLEGDPNDRAGGPAALQFSFGLAPLTVLVGLDRRRMN
jgi:hypothetical protein